MLDVRAGDRDREKFKRNLCDQYLRIAKGHQNDRKRAKQKFCTNGHTEICSMERREALQIHGDRIGPAAFSLRIASLEFSPSANQVMLYWPSRNFGCTSAGLEQNCRGQPCAYRCPNVPLTCPRQLAARMATSSPNEMALVTDTAIHHSDLGRAVFRLVVSCWSMFDPDPQ